MGGEEREKKGRKGMMACEGSENVAIVTED
jgi:hypothetical protein